MRDVLVHAAERLNREISRLKFAPPVTHVYNPLEYAWPAYEEYVRRFGNSAKRIIFLGMNPGPYGMVQTGVPFGEIAAVRDWLGIKAEIAQPKRQHARRPVMGFACGRSEVSGRRLWGLFAKRFGRAEDFFAEHLVMNYCPLAFLESTGRNRTPDKLPANEKEALFRACDEHLRTIVQALQPEWLIGIGGFAYERAASVVRNCPVKSGRILHPSPASPVANRGWAEAASEELHRLGVWGVWSAVSAVSGPAAIQD